MRPRYETLTDLQREAFIAGMLAYAWRCNAEPAEPMESAYDWRFMRPPDVVALAEIKRRTCPSTRYPTYMLASRKVLALASEADRLGCCGVLAVSWTDRVGWIRVGRLVGLPRATGGRWDRNDPHDVESVVHVGISHFTMLRRARFNR